MKILTLLSLGLFATSLFTVTLGSQGTRRSAPLAKKHIPALPQLGPSEVEFTSSATSPLDGPKLSIVNATVFDWWYFDAVAADLSATITIVFFTALTGSLGLGLDLPNVNNVVVTGMFDDGSTFTNALPAREAVITTDGDGSSGTFSLTDAGWSGTPDLSEYTVSIDSTLYGLRGRLKLSSIAPAHYPCNLNSDAGGVSEVLCPHIGWANAIPDSNAEADFTVGGKALHFTGFGYHDKNWGDSPLGDNVRSWYWGHGHLGDYSLVWFDFLAPNETEFVSGFLAKDGEVLGAGCSGIRTRPTGANSEYPPANPGLGLGLNKDPDGFHIEFNLTGGQVFEADVKTSAIVWEPPIPLGGYTRWIGPITGGVKNGSLLKGVALWDWIRFNQ